jgi:hypothetical protein
MTDRTQFTEATELHFTVPQVAVMWGLSDETIRRLFADEPGVIKLGSSRSTLDRRRKVRLSIPLSVLQRVHRKLSER